MASAQNYVFTTLSDPNESNVFPGTFAEGINNFGEVAGYYYDDTNYWPLAWVYVPTWELVRPRRSIFLSNVGSGN